MEKGTKIQKYMAYLGVTYLARLKGLGRGVVENASGKGDEGPDVNDPCSITSKVWTLYCRQWGKH